MSTATILRGEVRCARKVMLRDPMAVFVTVVLPLLYLFIFATMDTGTASVRGQPGMVKGSTYVVASVIVIGVVSAAFTYLAAQLVHDREDGILKRLRSAPVRTSTFLAGPVINGTAASLTLAILMAALGRLGYAVSLPASHLLAAVITVIIGALAFCALGCLVTVVIRSATAAMPLLFGVTLALFFLSGNFFPTDSVGFPSQRGEILLRERSSPNGRGTQEVRPGLQGGRGAAGAGDRQADRAGGPRPRDQGGDAGQLGRC